MNQFSKTAKDNKDIFLRLLQQASQDLGNAGCNDFYMENTDANWAIYEAVCDWNQTDQEDRIRRPDNRSRPIPFQDWILLDYFIFLMVHCNED